MDRITALAMKERLSTALFDNSPCHIAVIDRNRQVVLTNPAFERTFANATHTTCHQLYKDCDIPCDDCLVEHTFADGVAHLSKEQGITRCNKAIFYEAQAIPLLDEGGAVEHVVLISTDTTRTVELEQGLNQAERLANVGLSAAGLAHTIKNILAGLEGGIYMVDTGIAKEEPQRLQSGWKMVQDYIHQVESLVKNLLSYARQSESHPESVDLGELADEIVALYASKANMAGIALSTHTAAETPHLLLDRAAMHAALANLVTNAIDACTWDPNLDKDHSIVISIKPQDSGARIEVADNGTGISAENQQRLLVTTFTTKGMRGTGLGLLLTKKTAAAHGGALSFESRAGEGTTFRIDIPSTPHGVQT